MSQYFKTQHEYQNPVEIFSNLDLSKNMCFLHTSSSNDSKDKLSIIGLFPSIIIKETSLEKAYSKMNVESNNHWIENLYVGHISYEVNHEFEKLPVAKPSHIQEDNIIFIKYGLYLLFDLEHKKFFSYTISQDYLSVLKSPIKNGNDFSNLIRIHELKSNFSKSSYIKAIEKIKNYIIEGDIFEANLTAKFFGKLHENISGQQIFLSLLEYSPSQYSAYIKNDELEIISSSPERFLHGEGRLISSKPIKGTRKRANILAEDEKIIIELKNSEKDKAENLMIVDLVRNDLGRIAKIGSVNVPELFKIESYKTVHQMVSTVTCEIDQRTSYFDVLKATFPPGSMTGAPKIRAMEIITELERIKRGVYSGAIGMISPEHYMDLSVVIRTIIKHHQSIEFQAGGAIVYDSIPEEEYEEMVLKLSAIEKTLNTSIKNL